MIIGRQSNINASGLIVIVYLVQSKHIGSCSIVYVFLTCHLKHLLCCCRHHFLKATVNYVFFCCSLQ